MIFTTDPIEPSRLTHGQKYVWHAIECVRGSEAAAKGILEKDPACRFAFYPATVSSWPLRGKIYKRERAEVPGLVFARFNKWPDFTKLCKWRVILKPFTVGDRIVAFHPDSIRILRNMPTAAELRAEAERQTKLLRAGDTARFKEGALSALSVAVTAVDGDEVRFTWTNGLPGKTTADQLVKVAE